MPVDTSAIQRILDEETTRAKNYTHLLERLKSKKVDLVKGVPVQCHSCKLTSALGKWTFIQNHWYTSPHGCTEGDYWNSDKKEDCHVTCPLCGTQNRIYNHSEKAFFLFMFDIAKLSEKDIFAEVYDEYDGKLKKMFPVS